MLFPLTQPEFTHPRNSNETNASVAKWRTDPFSACKAIPFASRRSLSVRRPHHDHRMGFATLIGLELQCYGRTLWRENGVRAGYQLGSPHFIHGEQCSPFLCDRQRLPSVLEYLLGSLDA